MILKCKMCGGDIEFTEDKALATCECCGNTMTLPKINNDQRASLFNRGNQFRRNGEFDKALGVYENILREDDGDAEAHWCCALCRFGIDYVEDPATYEWIPTCHRASFESILEDVDYLAALEYSDGVTKKYYQKEAIRIADVQKHILATSQNEKPFDVFICYNESDEKGERTVDSTLAQDIYYQLTDAGFRVFFSRITLEDKVGSEYEPYIFAALNSAKVMIVVGTKPEYYNAVWVKNEWSRYLAMMRKDRTKLLLPCYRDMDPYDMPEALSILQSYDMSKIGFIQDLIRGVRKIVQVETEKKPEHAMPNVPNTSTENTAAGRAAAKIKRGKIALQDKEWELADRFFEEALDEEPETAEGYLGKFLVEEQCSTMQELLNLYTKEYKEAKEESFVVSPQYDRYEEHIQQQVEEYGIKGYLSEKEIQKLYPKMKKEQEVVLSCIGVYDKQLAKIKDKFETNRLLNHARQYAEGDLEQEINQTLSQIYEEYRKQQEQSEHAFEEERHRITRQFVQKVEEADDALKEKHQKVLGQMEKEYQKCIKMMQDAHTGEQCDRIISRMRPLSTANYKDSRKQFGMCNLRVRELKEEEQLREKEEKYQECLQKMKDATTEEELRKVEADWWDLKDYKDAKTQLENCRKKIKKLAAKQKWMIAVSIVVLVAIVVLSVYASQMHERQQEVETLQQEIRNTPVDTGVTLDNGDVWQVLDRKEGETLLIKVIRISCQGEVVDEEEASLYWKYNPVRKYLNDTYKKELSPALQSMIVSKQHNNGHYVTDKNGKKQYVKEKDTKDDLFLLSLEEVKNYRKAGRHISCDATRTVSDNKIMILDSYQNDETRSYTDALQDIRPAMWVKTGTK